MNESVMDFASPSVAQLGCPGSVAGAPANTLAARKVERAIAYMRENLDKPVQVPTLAAALNISPSHFFALFKQFTGRPPIEYFIRLRMRRACELLQDESLPVKQVAAELGYEDPFYFSRLFKAVHQVAPSHYRRAQSAAAGGDPVALPEEGLPARENTVPGI